MYTLFIRTETKIIRETHRWLASCLASVVAYGCPARVEDEDGVCCFFRADGTVRIADHR